MIVETIFGFALALLVGVTVGLALTISSQQRRLSELGSLLSQQEGRVKAAILEANKQSPALLKVQVDDLAAALDALSARNRQEFGKLWGKIGGGRSNGRTIDNDTGEVLTGDAEFEAMLALQRATTVHTGDH